MTDSLSLFPSPPSPSAVLYIRVSTDEQAIHGVSLDTQKEKLLKYCSMRDLPVEKVICDAGVSGHKPLSMRPGGREVQRLVKQKLVTAVVAYKLDRLFRNCADCLTVTAQWDKAEVALHLVDMGGQTLDTSSAMGRFFLTVMAGASELERGLVAERTTAALGHKRSMGQRIGEIPYGWRVAADGSTLLQDPGEQALIDAVFEARGRGLSHKGIAAELTAQGYTTRKGTPLAPTQVRRILISSRIAS